MYGGAVIDSPGYLVGERNFVITHALPPPPPPSTRSPEKAFASTTVRRSRPGLSAATHPLGVPSRLRRQGRLQARRPVENRVLTTANERRLGPAYSAPSFHDRKNDPIPATSPKPFYFISPAGPFRSAAAGFHLVLGNRATQENRPDRGRSSAVEVAVNTRRFIVSSFH